MTSMGHVVGMPFLLLATCAAAAAAQSVAGRVVDRERSAPLGGVVVQLLDSAGTQVARTLTTADGAFRLRAPRSGAYVVRALRIGFSPGAAQSVALRDGTEVRLPGLVAGAPLQLDTVRVAAQRECRIRPDSASATFALWEQIRTALTAAQLTGTDRRLATTLVAFGRALDPSGRRVVRQESSLRSGMAGTPWRSVPVDSLSTVGYAVTERGGATITYFAPDLAVLVSDQFVAEHCMQLVSEGGRSGIAFEPTRGRRHLAGIAGTLWVDRRTLELRTLDFRYVNLPRRETAVAGGRVEFTRLPDGSWVISRWSIRAPVVETRYGVGGALREGNQVAERTVHEVREEGGLLALVLSGRDTLWSNPSLVASGRVVDSTGRGVVGAGVRLRGTRLAARTDSGGRFRMQNVIPGAYTIDAQTDAMAAAGARQSAYVSLTGEHEDIVLQVPSDEQMVAQACGRTTGGMLGGEVIRADSLASRAGAVLTVEWTEFQAGSREIVRRGRALATSTDGQGHWRACGLPLRTPIVVRASADGRESLPDTVRIPGEPRFAFTSLALTEAAETFTLAGRVLSDVDGSPVADALVSLPSAGLQVATAADGAFMVHGIPEGVHEISVRRLGHRPGRSWVAFADSRLVERNFLLSRATALDAIAVTAVASLAEFEERRRVGLGSFMTRAQLENMEAQELPAILSRLRGPNIIRAGTAAYVASSRGHASSLALQADFCSKIRFEGRAPDPPNHCACYAQVYLDNALLYAGSPGETVPDINNIPAAAIEALEYYAGPSQSPVLFNRLNSQCGILVIHTRRGD